MAKVIGTKKEVQAISLLLTTGSCNVPVDELKHFGMEITDTNVDVSYEVTDLQPGEGMTDYYGIVMFGPIDKDTEEGEYHEDEI